MKRLHLVIIGILIAITLLLFVYFSFFHAKTQPAGDGPGTLIGTDDTDVKTPLKEGEGLKIILTDGATLLVTDFTKEGTQPEYAKEAGYNVAGSGSEEYAVTYLEGYEGGAGTFTISLLKEPLGEVRKKAEESIIQKLGITRAQLCVLPVEVWTSVHVNELYAGYNLGISSCTGSVGLP